MRPRRITKESPLPVDQRSSTGGGKKRAVKTTTAEGKSAKIVNEDDEGSGKAKESGGEKESSDVKSNSKSSGVKRGRAKKVADEKKTKTTKVAVETSKKDKIAEKTTDATKIDDEKKRKTTISAGKRSARLAAKVNDEKRPLASPKVDLRKSKSGGKKASKATPDSVEWKKRSTVAAKRQISIEEKKDEKSAPKKGKLGDSVDKKTRSSSSKAAISKIEAGDSIDKGVAQEPCDKAGSVAAKVKAIESSIREEEESAKVEKTKAGEKAKKVSNKSVSSKGQNDDGEMSLLEGNIPKMVMKTKVDLN